MLTVVSKCDYKKVINLFFWRENKKSKIHLFVDLVLIYLSDYDVD
jgi:hypothetical protein